MLTHSLLLLQKIEASDTYPESLPAYWYSLVCLYICCHSFIFSETFTLLNHSNHVLLITENTTFFPSMSRNCVSHKRDRHTHRTVTHEHLMSTKEEEEVRPFSPLHGPHQNRTVAFFRRLLSLWKRNSPIISETNHLWMSVTKLLASPIVVQLTESRKTKQFAFQETNRAEQ
jgi:hypothetical protein